VGKAKEKSFAVREKQVERRIQKQSKWGVGEKKRKGQGVCVESKTGKRASKLRLQRRRKLLQ